MGIRVLVSGSGKMGREVLAAICRADDLEAAGVLDLFAKGDSIALPDGSGTVPFGSDATGLFKETRPDVAVDFSNAEWTPRLADAALAAGVRLVIGTTGLTDAFLENLAEECSRRNLGAVVAPNFAIGAVLMQHMSALAARYYDYAEIIELHHEGKADAPSGTSLATAKAMAAGREKAFVRPPTQKETVGGTRGAEAEGIAIHSVRLPGLVAHQEVIFGGRGETLRIRHDSLGRDSFMPGVMMAIRHVMEHPGLVVGAEQLLDLK
jgi:4-hydroxy-tetrahydrodipicolinate reductase